ncbi:MAG TPA: L-seryl-tRNA(Sec) selenium transferase [Dehalococcoidales bacterium]
MTSEFRKLPSVDQLLSHELIVQLSASYPRTYITNLVRTQLEDTRRAIASGKKCPPIEEIAEAVVARARKSTTTSLRPVVNATGVVLHTNLGRAPLSQDAIEAMRRVSSGFSNLEFDLENGARGSRQAHVERLICEVTGAEAGLVVNNNAAAVLLGLSAHAKRKEIVVSRGQAVEIGDSFRIPDVMRQSGAKLVEVGTTNCTYATDYEQVITASTVAFLRVHSSNFKVIGFTNEVSIEELVTTANKHELPVFDDLGSGCFLETTTFGLASEPMVQRSIAAGAALVFFSGDKLVGGPQAGIIAGKKQYVDKLRRHPLARAVRIDKIRLAGLIATLIHYVTGEATVKIPIWRMIAMPVAEIERRACVWAEATDGLGRVTDGESMVGGGSLPGSTLPTKLVVIGQGGKKASPLVIQLSRTLREWQVPIIGRVQDNTFLLDPRSVLPEEDATVCKALKELCRRS